MRNVLKFIALILLIYFIWNFNIKPFNINTKINIAVSLAEEEDMCLDAIRVMENSLSKKSYLDHYLGVNYVGIISNCINEEAILLRQKAIALLEESNKDRPYYTRNYMLLGAYNRDLMKIDSEHDIQEAINAFEKAHELSPNRKSIIVELNNLYIQERNYTKLIEIYPKLLRFEPDNAQYYASLAFAHKELGNIDEAKKITLYIIEHFPEHKETAEIFLKSIE